MSTSRKRLLIRQAILILFLTVLSGVLFGACTRETYKFRAVPIGYDHQFIDVSQVGREYLLNAEGSAPLGYSVRLRFPEIKTMEARTGEQQWPDGLPKGMTHKLAITLKDKQRRVIAATRTISAKQPKYDTTHATHYYYAWFPSWDYEGHKPAYVSLKVLESQLAGDFSVIEVFVGPNTTMKGQSIWVVEGRWFLQGAVACSVAMLLLTFVHLFKTILTMEE